MKDFEQHEHRCPDCKQLWCCHATADLTVTMNDASGYADCRWHTDVVCPCCMKKRTATGRSKSWPALQGPPRDIHSEMARRMFGDDFTSEQRKVAKNRNYMDLYSHSSDTMLDYGTFERYAQARELLPLWVFRIYQKFRRRHQALIRWMEHWDRKFASRYKTQIVDYPVWSVIDYASSPDMVMLTEYHRENFRRIVGSFGIPPAYLKPPSNRSGRSADFNA